MAALNFASATALVSGNTGTIASGIGDEATALVLYGDGVTSDTRVAVATIAADGGVTAATDVAILKGIASAFANFADADFNLD